MSLVLCLGEEENIVSRVFKQEYMLQFFPAGYFRRNTWGGG